MQQLGKVLTQTTWAKASDTINNNSDKIYEAITQVEHATTKHKGFYSNFNELIGTYPQPTVGLTALVYNEDNDPSYPYDIYHSVYNEVSNACTWEDTGHDAPITDVNITDIHKSIDDLQEQVNTLVPKVITQSQQEEMQKENTWEEFLEINPIVYVTEE